VGEAVALISEYGLPWEAVPDALLNEPLVLGALIPSMGQTALIRNLSRFTRAGIDSSVLTSLVANRDRLIEGRVHPISVLLALSSYASGRSKGGKEWAPQAKILDALNDAFYLAFAAVEPANKRTMLALDVSGSMAMADIANTSLTPREASVAMAMVTLASEPWVSIMGFSNNFVPLPISSRQRLDDAVRSVSGLPFQTTDCAQPMIYALANKIPVDTFVIYTDNETWSGKIHPFQALRQYRERMGIDAKLIVSAFSATEFTIADPSDRGMLDTVGLDASLPGLLNAFSRGDV
jgi:60 kDa SS-A/Ro ribonucleoprotein